VAEEIRCGRQTRPSHQQSCPTAQSLTSALSFLEQIGALLMHGIDALRVTYALLRLPCALFTHVAADALQMLDAAADISELSRARSCALRTMRGALLTPAQPIAAACHQAKPLPESPGNPGKTLRPGVEDAPGMLLAPRRGVHDRRAAVNDRPNVRDDPTTLTGMMIERCYGAEAIRRRR
jgi:hypothetical protein